MTHRHFLNSDTFQANLGGGVAPCWSALIAVFMLACSAALASLRAEETPNPSTTSTAQEQRQKLLAERGELLLSASRACKAGQYEETIRCLEQLVPLYRQLYPVSEYPDGHISIVQVYQGMCEIAEIQKDSVRIVRLGEEGLRACRKLCPNHDRAEVNKCEVILHKYVGRACFALDDLAKSRQHFLRAAEICRLGLNDDPDGGNHASLASDYDSLAEISMKEGDIRAADEYSSLALTEFQYRLRSRYILNDQRRFAHYLFSRGNALRHIGKYASSLELTKEAHDINVRLFAVTRLQEDYASALQTLVLQGVLLRDLGDMESAYEMLENARCRLQNVANHNVLYPHSLEAVLCNLIMISAAQRAFCELEVYRDALQNQWLLQTDGLRGRSDPIETAELLRNLGFAFREAGDFALAEQYFEKALASISDSCVAFAEVSKSMEVIAVRHDLALLYSDIGRCDDAYTQYAEALHIAQRIFPTDKFPRGHPLLSGVMQNMATHCWLVGETDMSADLYHQVMVMNESLYPVAEFPNGHPRLQQAYSAWSDVLAREKRFDEAEVYAAKSHDSILKRSIAEAKPHPRENDDLADSWTSLGRLRRARGDHVAAKKLFGQALESYQSRYAGDDSDGQLLIALTLAELGRTDAAEGNVSAALEYHRRSVAIRRRLFPQPEFPVGHPFLANALRDLGITCLDAGEPAEAFRLLAESVDMEHAIGESFFGGGSEAQLLNLAARKFQSLGPLLEAWQQAGLPSEAVYQYVWMRHGFVPRLIADRQRALRDLARDTEPATYEKYVTARQNLARILLVSVTDDAARNTARLERIQQLNSTKEDLEHQLTRSLESTRSGLQAATDVRTLVNVLPERSVFVDFFSFSSLPYDATMPSRSNHGAADRVVAFIVGRNRPIAFVDVGDPGAIAALIAAWNDELSADHSGSAGTALRQKLWDPVSVHFPADADTIYIAPDGALADVAWGALPCPTDSGVLLERYAIATVPHGQFLLDQLQGSPSIPVPLAPVLAVGDVDYGSPGGDASASSLGLKQLKWEKLPGSRRELDAIASHASGRELNVLTGTQATTENVLQGLSTARVAHFATHGFFLDDETGVALELAGTDRGATRLTANRTRSSVLGRSPLLRSGLALAGANVLTPGDELGIPVIAQGILTAESVAVIDGGHLQLVVLSACDTTRGDTAVGEGVLGLQGAFHIAGARNVIAGLWKVPDEATAELMGDFYRLLWEQQKTPLAALREAQLNMLRRARSNPASSRGPELSNTVRLDSRPGLSPQTDKRRIRDWAGFVLSGPGF